MFYLPVCVSKELNLYADVSWYVLLRRLNKRAERCTKRGTLITLIQQPHFADVLHTALRVTQNAVQTTALQTDIANGVRPSNDRCPELHCVKQNVCSGG